MTHEKLGKTPTATLKEIASITNTPDNSSGYAGVLRIIYSLNSIGATDVTMSLKGVFYAAPDDFIKICSAVKTQQSKLEQDPSQAHNSEVVFIGQLKGGCLPKTLPAVIEGEKRQEIIQDLRLNLTTVILSSLIRPYSKNEPTLSKNPLMVFEASLPGTVDFAVTSANNSYEKIKKLVIDLFAQTLREYWNLDPQIFRKGFHSPKKLKLIKLCEELKKRNHTLEQITGSIENYFSTDKNPKRRRKTEYPLDQLEPSNDGLSNEEPSSEIIFNLYSQKQTRIDKAVNSVRSNSEAGLPEIIAKEIQKAEELVSTFFPESLSSTEDKDAFLYCYFFSIIRLKMSDIASIFNVSAPTISLGLSLAYESNNFEERWAQLENHLKAELKPVSTSTNTNNEKPVYDGLKNERDVLALFKEDPNMTHRKIAERLNIGYDVVRSAIKRLREKGQLPKLPTYLS